jgi:hypothetical protein
MDFIISQSILAFITNFKYTVEKSRKNKNPIGAVGGCPGYWGRGNNCHGYCGEPINE